VSVARPALRLGEGPFEDARLCAAAERSDPVLSLSRHAAFHRTFRALPHRSRTRAPRRRPTRRRELHRRPERLEAKDAGPGQVARAELDDSVPLPVPARWEARPEGDRLLEPASGDPFFLAFAGGSHYPPADERIDPLLLAQIQAQPLDGRGDARCFAFATFSKRITPARVAQLEQLGAKVLSFHPHYTLKLAFPVGALDSLAALDFVRWLGVPRAAQKLHPRLVHELAQWPANRPMDLYVNVYESDLGPAATYTPVGVVHESAPGGVVTEGDPAARAKVCMSNRWQQRALEASGIEVLEYIDRIRAFRCRSAPGASPLSLRAPGEAPAARSCFFPDMHTSCGTQTTSSGVSREIVLRRSPSPHGSGGRTFFEAAKPMFGRPGAARGP